MAWYDDLGNIGAQIGAYGSWPIGLGIGRPPGGYTGGYPQNPPLPLPNPLRPGGTPPSPGGAAPGAMPGLPTPQPAAPGAPLPGLQFGNYQKPWDVGALGADVGRYGNWTPATAVPPGMAQYGLSPHSGLLGSLAGVGADVGRAGNWPNAQASGGIAGGQPPSAYYDIQPGGGSGAGAVTGDKLQPQYPGQNIPLPTRKPEPVPPVPQRKPQAAKPKPKRQPQGDQAQYTSKTNWQSHNEAYNPIQGNFGYQAWRKPR